MEVDKYVTSWIKDAKGLGDYLCAGADWRLAGVGKKGDKLHRPYKEAERNCLLHSGWKLCQKSEAEYSQRNIQVEILNLDFGQSHQCMYLTSYLYYCKGTNAHAIIYYVLIFSETNKNQYILVKYCMKINSCF